MKTYRKDVTDEEKDSFMAAHLAELMKGVVPRVKAGPKEGAKNGAGAGVTSEERELLENILAERNLTVTARTYRLGLSPYKMNDLKKSATKEGLIQQFTVNWGKEHGGNVTLLALTEEGYKVLGKVPANKPPKNVSLEHWWWQNAICSDLNSQGIKAEVEKSRNGVRADVCMTLDGGRERAVEVELTPKNAVSNVAEDLKAGFDKVVCCCKHRLLEREISRRLVAYEGYESIKDKVVVRVLTELPLVKELCGEKGRAEVWKWQNL